MTPQPPPNLAILKAREQLLTANLAQFTNPDYVYADRVRDELAAVRERIAVLEKEAKK